MTLPRSHRSSLLLAAVTAGALCLLSIAAFDGPLAIALSSLSSGSTRAIQRVVGVFEVLFAFGISQYLYGALVVAAGLATFRTTKGSLLPWALLFVGLSHVTARFVADILKPPFSRLRPFEAIGSGGWHDTFFAPVGNSFPSGHAVHFWSLFFPLAVLFPQYRLPLLVLPVAMSVGRVAVNRYRRSRAAAEQPRT